MELAEAILLGLPEIEFSNKQWLTSRFALQQADLRVLLREDHGRDCVGCLIGAALYATGTRHINGFGGVAAIKEIIREHWPPPSTSSRNIQVLLPTMHKILRSRYRKHRNAPCRSLRERDDDRRRSRGHRARYRGNSHGRVSGRNP